MLYRENGQFKTTYLADGQIFPITQDRWMIGLMLAFAFLVAPFIFDEYMFRAILVPFLILSLAAVGVNILVGYCGQITLGAGAFMSVGAYAAYNFMARVDGMPIILALILAGLTSAGVGVIFGIPSLRVRGLYLAIATLAAQFFIDWAFLRINWFTLDSASGSVSVADINVFGWIVNAPNERYLFCLIILVLMALAAKNMTRSAIGRQWMAIRDMDVAAEVIGIRPMFAKLSAFAVCSFYLGVAGALWGFVNLGSWEPAAFAIERSFQLLFMVIIGGLGSILGCFLGAAFIVIMPIFLNQFLPWFGGIFGITISTAGVSHAELIIFGALIIFFLIVEPHGMARLWATGKEKLRLWPFPH